MRKYPQTPPRLTDIFPAQPTYFVTCCVKNRRSILAADKVHHAFIEFAQRATRDHGIAVGRYVIMPDHLHLFVSGSVDFELGRWVGTLKRILAREAGPKDEPNTVWQRGFFDHVLRNSESYSEKWDYVHENPVRAGLVASAEDWPFAGEIVDLYFD
jgi:REP element-mobilizing transposase RayT